MRACSRAASASSRDNASMKFENRVTSAGDSVTAKALGAIKPRTPTRRWRSISRVSLRPISTGWRLLRNGFANVPSTRRSRRSSNCWSPMVSQRLPVQCAHQGGSVRQTWSSRGLREESAGAATTVVRSLGRVAELADAQDSGSCVRKDVGVQVPPRPHTPAPTHPLAHGTYLEGICRRTVGRAETT
jgi:hypothetical protein